MSIILSRIHLILDNVCFMCRLSATLGYSRPCERKRKKVRKHCRADRHATKSPAPATHTHALLHPRPHALSRAGSCSPVERHRARGRDGWAAGGGGEVHRGREAAERRGGLPGRRWEVSGCAVKRTSAPLALPFPSCFSLSFLLLPSSLPPCVWIGPPRPPQGSFTGNAWAAPPPITEEVKDNFKLWLVHSTGVSVVFLGFKCCTDNYGIFM